MYRVFVKITADVRPPDLKERKDRGSQTRSMGNIGEVASVLEKRSGERPHLHPVLRCLRDATRPTKPISGIDGDILADTGPGPNHTLNESGMFTLPRSMPVVDRRRHANKIPSRSWIPAPAYSCSIVESTVDSQGDDQISNADEIETT